MTWILRSGPRAGTRTSRAWLGALLVPCAFVLTGCDDGLGDEQGGKVVIDGSSTVFRVSRFAQLAYDEVRPEVAVLLGNHGSGGGFSRYLLGEIDIVDASRDAKPAEYEMVAEAGMPWTRFVVGYDGITVAVNPSNTWVESLTVEQLGRLYEPESQVRTWRDLDPAWPEETIVLFAPDTDSGTFEYFHEAILGSKVPRQQRPDTQPSPDDNVLVRGIEGEVHGIGYFGFAYYTANQESVKAVAIQAGPDAEPVSPSLATILDGRYRPLARPLYLFVRNESLARPEVAEFVRYYLEHVESFASKAGYVPPNETDRRANAASLAEALASLAASATTSVEVAP